MENPQEDRSKIADKHPERNSPKDRLKVVCAYYAENPNRLTPNNYEYVKNMLKEVNNTRPIFSEKINLSKILNDIYVPSK